MPRFQAIVCEGTVHNYARNESREGRWIYAREIPLQYLPRYSGEHHPHRVEGMAWDLDAHTWKNLKNATVHRRDIRLIDETFV